MNKLKLTLAALLTTALTGTLMAGNTPKKLTVMAWNTEHYGWWWKSPEQCKILESNMFAVVQAVQPDVLLIVETYGSFDRFRAALPGYDARLLGACNSVYSKYPIVAVHDTYRESKLYGTTNGYDYAGATGPFTIACAEIAVGERRVRCCPIAMNWEPSPPDLPDVSAAELLAAEAGPQPNGGSPRPKAMRDILASMSHLLAEADQMPMVIGGDFNSHSHLDWTAATAAHFDHKGRVVAWPVSQTMYEAGFIDTYRHLHPDPVSNYGTTYMRTGKNACYARIDFIYSKGKGLKPISSEAFNGLYHKPFVFRGKEYSCFPSDHGFLITTFEM